MKDPRHAKINEIYKDVLLAKRGAPPPDMVSSLVGMVVGMGIGALLAKVLELPSATSVGVLFSTGGIGTFLGLRLPKHKDWESRIFSRLAEYTPMDVEGYRVLQAKAAEKSLGYLEILRWAQEEQRMLLGAAEAPRTPGDLARSRFAEKVLQSSE